jgi:hypothetical protein
VVALTLDPLRSPILDRAGHEAGHLAGLRWFGYTADVVKLDLRWGDHGWHGLLDHVRRTTGDEAREPFDRALIAAAGPVLAGGSLDDPSAAADRRNLDLWVMSNWPIEAWRLNATEQARRLARTPAFAATWRTFVVRLHDLGEEYVELRGDDVDAFLESVPDAGLLPGAPRPSAATSAGVPVT